MTVATNDRGLSRAWNVALEGHTVVFYCLNSHMWLVDSTVLGGQPLESKRCISGSLGDPLLSRFPGQKADELAPIPP